MESSKPAALLVLIALEHAVSGAPRNASSKNTQTNRFHSIAAAGYFKAWKIIVLGSSLLTRPRPAM